MMLMAGGLFAAPRISVGIGFGAPVAVVRPVCPGPGYVWTDGYYGPNGVWIAGFWAPPMAIRHDFVRVAPGFDRGYAFDHRFEHFRR